MEDYKVEILVKKQKDDIDTNYLISENLNKEKLNKELNNIKYNGKKQKQLKVQEQKTLIYGSNKTDEVPYKVISHTSINKNTPAKKQQKLTFPKNKRGQVIMNFRSIKNRDLF